MTDEGGGQPAADQPPHPIPGDAAVLATPRQPAVPEPPYLESDDGEGRAVHGDAVIADVPIHDRAQPLAHRGNRVVRAAREIGFATPSPYDFSIRYTMPV